MLGAVWYFTHYGKLTLKLACQGIGQGGLIMRRLPCASMLYRVMRFAELKNKLVDKTLTIKGS